MKNLHIRVLAFFVIIVMMIGNIGAVVVSAEEIQDPKLKEAISTLNALSILQGYPDGTFKPENSITRAEFAAVVTRLLGLDEAVALNVGQTPFTDVPDSHWATGNINLAYNMGIISGHGDGTFGPEDPVTFEQAVKMIVAALGYTDEANARGGYPDGYLASAADKGILKDAIGEIGQNANRGLVAMLTYNALHADIRVQTGFGGSGSYKSGNSLINERLNTEQIKGQVTANSEISLYGGAATRNDEVEIDGYIYKLGDTNANEFLGYKVIAFVETTKEGEKVLKSVKKDDNKVITVQAPNIDPDTSTNRNVFVYWKDENDIRPESISLHSDLKVVVNNKLEKNYNDSHLMPEAGEVTLIDNGDDGSYDVAFIKSYKTYVVQQASAKNNTIYVKDGEPITLDPDNRDYEFKITRNGNEITIGALKEWDVLAIAEGLNRRGKTFKEVIVVNKIIDGTITEADNESVVINKKEYKYADSYKGEKLKLSDKAYLYLDINGRIAAAKITSSVQNNYGYLIDMASIGAVEKSVQFKIYTDKGQMRQLNGADKINIKDLNGDTKSYKPGELEDVLSMPGVIMYETNSRGEVNAIILPKQIDGSSARYDENNFSLDYKKEDALYKSGTAQFDVLYKMISGSSKKMFIPKDGKDNRFTTSYTFLNDRKYNIEIYDADENLNIGLVVVYETDGDASTYIPDQRLIIVDRINTAKDDGETVHKLFYYQAENKEKDLLAIDDQVLANVKKGDVIKIAKNGNDRIERVEVLTPAPGTAYNIKKDLNDSNISLVYGKVEDLKDMFIHVVADREEPYPFECSDAIAFKYDDKLEKVTTALLGELTGHEVLLRVVGTKVTDIIILD